MSQGSFDKILAILRNFANVITFCSDGVIVYFIIYPLIIKFNSKNPFYYDLPFCVAKPFARRVIMPVAVFSVMVCYSHDIPSAVSFLFSATNLLHIISPCMRFSQAIFPSFSATVQFSAGKKPHYYAFHLVRPFSDCIITSIFNAFAKSSSTFAPRESTQPRNM